MIGLVSGRTVLPLVIVGLAILLAQADRDQTAPHQSTVGVAARIDQIVLPGGELEVKPIEDQETAIVLRIDETYPHGTDYRYDLVFYGLEPGTYDLKDYLRRKDLSSTDSLPSIPVQITSVLPPGQILPNSLSERSLPRLGGYRPLLILLAVVWVIGLVLILVWGRNRRQNRVLEKDRPASFADRIRPLVQRAVDGQLTRPQAAELERMLLTYWRRRLKLTDCPAAEAIILLRQDQQAGPLMNQLEQWLHQPSSAKSVDVEALLQPYRDLPEEAAPIEQGRSVAEG